MGFVTIGSASHVGNRKDKNEDYFSFHVPEDGSMPKKGVLLVLADGMGGRAGGALAAKIAVEAMLEEYYRDKSSSIQESLNIAFFKANEEVIARGDMDRSVQGMATTLIATAVTKDRLYHAHVGDSRGYLIDGDRIIQLTEDHSIVAGLVKAGYITEEQAPGYPGGNVITRAIGLKDDLKVDVSEEAVKIRPGQYVMICCDGLHKDVPEQEILEIFNAFREPAEICDNLVERALNKSGDDNITVLVARIEKTHSGFFSNLKDRLLT